MQRATQRLAGALVLAVLLSGCALIDSDDERIESELVGTWRWIYSSGTWGYEEPKQGQLVQLHLSDRSEYLLEENGQSISSGRYQIEKDRNRVRFTPGWSEALSYVGYGLRKDTLHLGSVQWVDVTEPTYVWVSR